MVALNALQDSIKPLIISAFLLAQMELTLTAGNARHVILLA